MDNWKAIIFLLAFGQGAILSCALIVKGLGKQRFNFFLGLILVTFSLELLNAWGMQVKYHSSAHAIPFWTLQSYLILPPSVWFFSQCTTVPGFELRRRDWLFFLPAMMELIIQVGCSLYQKLTGHYLPSLLNNPFWFFVTELLPIMGMVVALWFYGKKLFYNSQFRKSPSLKHFSFFGFLVLLTLLWAAGVVFKWPVFSGIEIILTISLFTFGYIGYLHPAFFELPEATRVKTSERSEFEHFDEPRHLKRLMAAFVEEGIYTQSKLSLDDVASKLNLPSRYVSYLINKNCAPNFSHFVNTFRVEDVIRKLNDPAEQHKTILALALESGFNSKSSFNQVFKQHTGKSPSHYLMVQKMID